MELFDQYEDLISTKYSMGYVKGYGDAVASQLSLVYDDMLDDALTIERVRNYCNKIMLDGMGVPIEDPRFTARMTAHMILNKLDGEQ